MVTTLPVIAASLLLGQTVQAPVTSGPPQTSSKVYVYNNGVLVPYNDAQKGALFGQQPTTTESHHPILTKIHGWFKRGNNNNSTSNRINTSETPPPPTIISEPPLGQPAGKLLPPITSPPATPSTNPGDFPRKMPTTIQSSTRSIDANVQVKGDTISPAGLQSLPTPAKTPILPSNANRVGRDEKFEWITGQIEMEKGQYVLYYATPETVDTYHGRIQLSAQKVDMHGFSSGDLISVRGHLHTGGTVTYQLTSADLIEKAKK
jgi:hypothetical protein